MIKIKPANKLSAPDILITAVVIILAVLAALFLLFASDGTAVKITTDTETLVYPLAVNRELTVVSNGFTLTVAIKDNSVSVTGSDCPDGFCVHTPPLSRSGHSVICAPAHVSVEVTNAKDGDLHGSADAVAG